MRIAKKPKILKEKIILANLIRKHWKRDNYHIHPEGCYWEGTFDNREGLKINIYFQRYTGYRKPQVDFIHFSFKHNDPKLNNKTLLVGDIKGLLRRFERAANEKATN